MELKGRGVVVIGLGRSGVAAAMLCARNGARVIASDTRDRPSLGASADLLEQAGASLFLGGHDDVPWNDADVAVVSPGVPAFHALAAFERSGREVIGELELASRFIHAPIALIGGTNGKSTVTTWIADMLEHTGLRVFAGGNLGDPPAESVDRELDVFVLEISSFQAERVPTLHARASALLNVTDDHLDRYASFDDYAHAKGNPFANMTADDVAVIPAGDPVCLREASRGCARKALFGAGGDVAVEGSSIVDRVRGARYDLSSLRLPGLHNQTNACAAIAMAAELGASRDAIAASLASFRGLAHRMAFVGEVRGVRFYDDSKGTNVGASAAALRGLSEPKAVLIAGGRDKLGSYDTLVDALRERGRALVVIGEAADRIAGAAQGVLPIVRAATMQEAVRKSLELALGGDAVLLSPACSSYDMFRDYHHRAAVFCQAVGELVAEAAEGAR